MICIPYIINNNYKIARLGGSQSAVPYYIIESRPNNSQIHLFDFETSFFAFDPEAGLGENGENDYVFDIMKDSCSVTLTPPSHIADIVIAVKKHHKSSQELQKVNFVKDGLCVRDNQVFFDLSKVGYTSRVVSTVRVTISDVETTEVEPNCTFGINIAQRKNIYDIVIDFGSEASQIWTRCRSNGSSSPGNHMPLFDNIKKKSPDVEAVEKNESIYQYDHGDNNLFRSLFFIKKEIQKAEIEKSDFTFINEEEKLVGLLQDAVALPNLKLMDHENVNLPTFVFNDTVTNIYAKSEEIRNEILKFFFDIALNHVDKLVGNGEATCKLTFLVPNTYSQIKLSEVYLQLVSDVSSVNNYSHIKPGIEVATFSESDASFFGWYHASAFDGEKRIMIVDIGKGTTDFSVLHVKRSNGQVTVERNARSGFVGAGNVMTFAILVAVLKLFADKLNTTKLSDVYDAVKGIAYENDSAMKNKLYKHLEALKCSEPIEGRTSLEAFIKSYDTENLNNVKNININKLDEILGKAIEEQCYVADDDPVVTAYAQLMAEQLVRELKYVYDESVPIDQVVFSGRGAKSKPLTIAIKNHLRQFNKEKEIDFVMPDPNDASAKLGCLKGPLNQSLEMDHMNMSIVGWPVQMNLQSNVEKMKDVGRRSGKKKSNEEPSRFRKFFGKILEEDNEEKTPEEVDAETAEILQIKVKKKVIDTNPTDMSDIQGQPVTINEDGNRFVLGNRRCLLKGRNILGRKRIFFDGYDFVLRDADRSFYFDDEDNDSDSSFVTETFFPMTENQGGVIMMPKVREVLNTVFTSEFEDDFTADVDDDFTATEVGFVNNDDDDFTA